MGNQPSRCSYCTREERVSPPEIPYITPTGEGVCEVHQQLLKSVGILLDRAHRHEVGTYRAFEETPWRYVSVDRPVSWTHDPFQKDRKSGRSH